MSHVKTLRGKVALITGGGRGIGATIAKRFSEEGAAVCITYANSADAANKLATQINANGGRALAIRADNAVVDELRAAVEETAAVLGGLDILVNNAGVVYPGLVADYSLGDLEKAIAINIKGMFVATQKAIQYMGRDGRVINIGSVSSEYVPWGGLAVYSMTKGAIASFTRGLALDLGPRGITVNNVQPGRIDTFLLRVSLERVECSVEHAEKMIALQRFGSCEDVAALVAFLASSEAAFITGANLKVDGGASL